MAGFLPDSPSVSILDVGSGPLTCLGKQCVSKTIKITAIDPLADTYNSLLDRYGINPPVRTIQGFAEQLTSKFSPETFDLVFSRNAIDHSYRPDLAIEEMIKVVKKNRYVVLGHVPNEGLKEGYEGLHQWDFTRSEYGDFIIKSPYQEVNITKKFLSIARIRCEIRQETSLSETEFLLAEILKL
jgi:ubiquinone/menaquinone biosynthesis C-methylase UbiE